jgi:hypothetical protein
MRFASAYEPCRCLFRALRVMAVEVRIDIEDMDFQGRDSRRRRAVTVA